MTTIQHTRNHAEELPARGRESTKLQDAGEVAGRLLLGSLFFLSGFGKVGAYAATAGYMASAGVPGALLPVVIALELAGGLAVILGWQTRLFSLLLAGFSVIAGALFHNNFADQMQMVMFFKNVAIAGAFLVLSARGAGRISLDARTAR